MAEDPMKAVLHYAHALKAPRIRESAARTRRASPRRQLDP